MADYYPLIAKAVAGLERNSGEARRSLYERARTALVAQLRGVTPALSESDITRERLALEEAIRKVEAESARKIRSEPLVRQELPPARQDPRVDPRADPRLASRMPDRPPAAAAPRPPERAPERAAPPPAAEDRRAPPMGEGTPSTTAAELRRRVPRPPSEPRSNSLSDEGLKGFRDVVAEAENLGEATAQAGKTAREVYAAVPAPSPEFERLEPHVEPEGLRPRARRGAPPREPDAARDPEAPRAQDYAPIPEQRGRGYDDAYAPPMAEPGRGRDGRSGIEAVQSEDFTGDDFSPYAERMRGDEVMDADFERPSQRARQRGAAEAGSGRALRASRGIGKLAALAVIALVVGGLVAWQWQPIKSAVSSLTAMFSSSSSSSPPVARETAPSRQKIPDRVGDQRGSSAPAAAVAQRVVLYEEDPADPAGKQYVGSAVWRSETVSPGPGQPPDMVVRADIEIPDRKMTLKWSLRRNSDKALPASHTIEIIFTLPSDFSHGGIQNIPGILMKQAEATRGVPLAGLAVKVTTNFFLIGLSSVESDMQRNIQLLKERSWFDVPVVYNDGRRAILAVEKGTPGERTFEEAFAAWGQN